MNILLASQALMTISSIYDPSFAPTIEGISRFIFEQNLHAFVLHIIFSPFENSFCKFILHHEDVVIGLTDVSTLFQELPLCISEHGCFHNKLENVSTSQGQVYSQLHF